MNKLFTLLILCSTFSFGQYIKEATIKLKKVDQPLQVLDLRYQGNKMIIFRLVELPNAITYAKVKHIEDLKFDSVNYSKEIPDLKQTYLDQDLTYQDGVYTTADDLINRTPKEMKVEKKQHYKSMNHEYKDDLVQFVETGKPDFPLKNIFAIVNNGEVYLNVKAIMKNRGEGNGNLSQDAPFNAFLRVKAGTDNYLYTEMPMTKTSSAILAGVAGGLTAGVASIGASAIMAGVYSGIANGALNMASPSLMKGIVFDTSAKEYDIFKNCKDFNAFMEKKNPNLIIDCDKDYNISTIRGNMNQL